MQQRWTFCDTGSQLWQDARLNPPGVTVITLVLQSEHSLRGGVHIGEYGRAQEGVYRSLDPKT